MPAATLYGGFWRRVPATLIDALCVYVVLVTIMVAFGISLRVALEGGPRPPSITAILPASLFYMLSWLYGACFESSAWQATPGKKVMGVRVTDLEGWRIRFDRALARGLAKWFSWLILFTGYLMVAFTKKKQALHDKLAGTLVRRWGDR